MKNIYILSYFLFCTIIAQGQYSLTTLSYTQDFNGLGTTTSANVTGGSLDNIDPALNGWYFLELLSSANTTITAGTGSSATGDTYNFGLTANTDRALGGLRSGTLNPLFGFYFTNNTGSTITALQISYTGKTWRRGFNNRADRIDFQYNTTATTLSGTGGVWNNVDALDYSSPVGGLPPGGGSILHSAVINNYILNISIPDGANFFIRWSDLDATDADDGLSIDDFTMTVADPTPVVYYSKSSGNLTALSTWGDDPSGSGTAPADFTAPFQEFNIVNRSSTILNANWTVSGVNSKVILGDGSSPAALILPSTAALTGRIDVSDLATLRLENNTLPTLGTIEPGSTVNFAQTGAFTLPIGTFHNLTITGGAKTLGNGNTSVNGNMVMDAVTSLNGWLGGSGSTIILSGNLTLQNSAAFATSGALPALEMVGDGTQTLSGGTIRLRSLQTTNDPVTLNIILSNASLILNGGGLELVEPSHTLSLNGNTLSMQGSAGFGDPANNLGSISGSSTSSIVIFKNSSNGGDLNGLRMTPGSQVLGTLEYRDLTSDPPLELASPLSISNTVFLHVNDDITTSSSSLLTLLEGAGFSGPGAGSAFINGPLARVVNAAGTYQFPVGGKTVFLEKPSPGNTSTFRVEYFQTGINTAAPLCPASAINGYKINEYFDVSRTSGTSPASFSVDFDGQNIDPQEWKDNIAPQNGDGIIFTRFNSTDGCWENVSSSAPILPIVTAPISTDVLNNFSPFTFGFIDFATLPVKFVDVKAYRYGNDIIIEWGNQTEMNVVNYAIERSASGRDFSVIGAVNAGRNDGSRADYSFLDAQPLPGVNYYRIRSLETDGKNLYSIIIKADTRNDNSDISIYPNPVVNRIMALQTPASLKGAFQLTVYNANGQKIYEGRLILNGGAATQSVELPAGIKSGFYNLRLTGKEFRFSRSFIIQ